MALAAATRRDETKVIGLIGVGHLLSHFYILTLPPLMPVLTEHFGVGYAAIGLAIAVFHIGTGIIQIPMGFLVDRFGARAILIGGLALEAAAIGAIGLFPSYEALLVMMALAGLGNSVFHPADYAILNARVGPSRLGRAFSLHTFAGYLGWIMAPAAMLILVSWWNLSTAFLVVGAVGLMVAALLAVSGDLLHHAGQATPKTAVANTEAGGPAAKDGMALLLSLPIIMCFLFFTMTSIGGGAIHNFSVSALVALYDAPLVAANAALTAFLAGAAVGILAGGVVADRWRRHDLVAILGALGAAAMVAVVAATRLPLPGVVAALAVAGFAQGMTQPSRDMLVRAVTPAHAMGKVFGFVSAGFNVSGIVTPLVFGWLMDQGHANLVFWGAALFWLLTMATVVGLGRRSRTD